MTQRIQTALNNVPSPLANALIDEFVDLESRFARRDWGPAELNGGRFAEAILRYLEWKKTGGQYTPLGEPLDTEGISNRIRSDGTMPRGLRLQALSLTRVLLGVRNDRDVAHLGAGIDVSEMDSRLVLRIASWILAEIIREEATLSSDEAQTIVDRLSNRELSLVEEIDGDLIVVATHLEAIERAMVALYSSYPKPLNLDVLRDAVKYKNSSRFNDLLGRAANEGLIHIKGKSVFLTSKGVAYVDKYLELEVRI